MKTIFACIAFILMTFSIVNSQSKTYFISASWNDNNSGLSIKNSLKTIEKVNQIVFQPGDMVLFETGGQGLSSLGGYKLKTGSPCINTGIFVPWNSKRDSYGNTVNDGSVDFGVYEQIGTGVFANESLEDELNSKATVRSRLA